MKRILAAGMLAATIFAMSCGNGENKTGSNSDSVLNSPPPAAPDNTTTPGTLADSTRRDSLSMDSSATMPR